MFREGIPFCRKQGQNEKSKRLAKAAIPQEKRKIRRRFAAGWVRSSPRKISSPKPTFSLVCARPNPSSQAAQPVPTSRKTPRPQTQYGENARPSPDGAPPGQCPRIAAPPRLLPAKSTADSAFARCMGMPLMAPPPCRLAGQTPDPCAFGGVLLSKNPLKIPIASGLHLLSNAKKDGYGKF